MAIIVTNQTKEYLASATETIKGLRDRYHKLYSDFSAEVEKHLQSGYTIPDVSKKIGDKKITSTQAMMAVNEAVYHGQQLANLYNSFYAPKLNEIKHDTSSAIFALTHAFNSDPEVQNIKTSAEKERQLAGFAFQPLQYEREVKKWHESFYFLGKYTENITYSLDRMQRMIDSLERLQSKELWIDSTAQEQAFSVINDQVPDFDDEAPLDAETDINKVNALLAKQDKDTQLLDFTDEVSAPIDSVGKPPKPSPDDDF